MKATGVKVDTRNALRQLRSGYNVITVADTLSPHIADLIFIPTTPETRKRKVDGVKTYFQSPESLILAKLRMIKATIHAERSQKDRDDVRAILANTSIKRSQIVAGAKRETTFEPYKELRKLVPSE